jgi:hypothetical protein
MKESGWMEWHMDMGFIKRPMAVDMLDIGRTINSTGRVLKLGQTAAFSQDNMCKEKNREKESTNIQKVRSTMACG